MGARLARLSNLMALVRRPEVVVDRIRELCGAVERGDLLSGFEVCVDLGPAMTEYKATASRAFKQTGIHPSDLGVVHRVEHDPGAAESQGFGSAGDVLSGDRASDALESRWRAAPWMTVDLERDVFWNPGHHEERSEERRVGKECRSRWSPY